MKHNNDGAIEISKRIINNDNSGIGAAFYNRSPRDVILEVVQAERGIAVCVPPHNQARKTDPTCSGGNISADVKKFTGFNFPETYTRSLVHS